MHASQRNVAVVPNGSPSCVTNSYIPLISSSRKDAASLGTRAAEDRPCALVKGIDAETHPAVSIIGDQVRRVLNWMRAAE